MRRLLAALGLALLAIPAGANAAGLTYVQAEPGKLTTVRAQLRALHLGGIAFPHLGMVAVRGKVPSSLRGVRYVHGDQRVELEDHQGTPLVYGGADPKPLWSGGFDGRGVGIAIVDSGVDGTHPDLVGRVTNTKIVDAISVTCPSDCDTDTNSGHGTHVAGIAAGNGAAANGYHPGVAPGSNVVAFSVGDGASILYALNAFDAILADKTHNIRVVNNSWGPEQDGSARADLTDPVHQATKKLHDAGITVVFSAGNNSTGTNDGRPAGASTCDKAAAGDCRMNTDAVAPWVISVAGSREDMDGGAGGQGLALFSSRGDPEPQTTLDGTKGVLYQPALTAPGMNVFSARAKTGATVDACPALAEAPACVPSGDPQRDLNYTPLQGTSMAAPHVTGAVAVVQSAAKAKLGRYLSPDEVSALLARTATPMTRIDAVWDWPCGDTVPGFTCGTVTTGFTGERYARWQVGAGMVNVAGAVAALKKKPAPSPARGR